MRLLTIFILPLLLFSEEMLTRTQALMGTFADITLPLQHTTHISKSFTHMKEIELALSSYDKNALVYQLNQTHFVHHNIYLKEAIQLSQKYYKETDGYFDITIGSISKKLYYFGEENEIIPSKEALRNAKRNIDAIHISNTKISTEENITIDLGGMGKGYAVDKVVEPLKKKNISRGIVALSGDIRCLDRCSFEIQSPFSEQTFAQLTSKIPQLSISTSGTYRRYVKNHTHHHLINPKTASQGKEFVSVSLFTRANNAKIDAYATAISVMPRKHALDFLKQHKKIGFVLVSHSGKIIYGNLEPFVSLDWLDYKENATIPSSTKKSVTKSTIESNLIHPDTTTPKEINK